MPNIVESLKNVVSKFGKREISSRQGESKLDSLKEEVKELKKSEFDEKIRVEGVKSTVDREKNVPEYKSLDQESSRAIEILFRGMTQDDFYKYKEDTRHQGISSGGEPFRCYAELDGTGNIIVTPNKMIKINNKDSENGEYSETRRQEDGSYATVELEKAHGEITGYSYYTRKSMDPETEKKVKKLVDYYKDPNVMQKLEMRGMSEQEKIIYVQELQKLGIKNSAFLKPGKMTKEEFEKSKAEHDGNAVQVSSMARYSPEHGEFMIGNCMFDGQDKPAVISFAGTQGPTMHTFRSYRRTSNGKYFDANSYKLVNGKPVYDIVELEDVYRDLNQLGIDTQKFEQMKFKVNGDLGKQFPKEAERIGDTVARGREEPDEHDNPFGNIPTERNH